MRSTSFAVLASVLIVLTGCSDGSGDAGPASGTDTTTPASPPETSATATAETFTFTGKQRIPVRLTMNARDDGGRHTPFFGGYRPTVRFGEGDSAIDAVCAVDTRGLDEFAPGAMHVVDLRCTSTVTVHEGALDFIILEGGREVGAGTVTP